MAGTAVLGRLIWQPGEIVGIADETPRVRSLTADLPEWPGHRAGQHLDVRLTAEDGYQAVRSYSIASPPEERHVVLTVERLDDGEVSPYLTEEVRVGDRLEFRGPIGGYFVWDVAQNVGGAGGHGGSRPLRYGVGEADEGRHGGSGPGGHGGSRPLQLIGGGSGVVPLMAMIRHRIAAGSDIPVRLLYSVRSPEDVIYREELGRVAGQNGIEAIYTFTRSQPEGWSGYRRRIDEAMLAEVVPHETDSLIYVCGPTRFVETAANALLKLGHPAGRIKTERFGPTGGQP